MVSSALVCSGETSSLLILFIQYTVAISIFKVGEAVIGTSAFLCLVHGKVHEPTVNSCINEILLNCV